jgi:hypothetical protein
MNNQKELLPYIRRKLAMLNILTWSLGSLLSNDPRHVYLVAQPGSFIHPSMPVLYLSSGQESSICTDLLETIIVSDVRSFAQDPDSVSASWPK